MRDIGPIARKIALPVASDYAQLRAEGLRHLQKLSGLIWTDHNTHDPGITMLEALCYALTDLAYRTDFPTRDLMTPPPGEAFDPGLPPAHEVLTTAPRTIADYRRLLLKIEGIRNAWLDPAPPESEVPIHADVIADALSYEPLNADGQPNRRVRLSGLYNVMLELDSDDELGPLTEPGLIHSVRKGPLKGAILQFEATGDALATDSPDLARDFIKVEEVNNLTRTPNGFTADIRLRLKPTRLVTLATTLRSLNARPRVGAEPLNFTPARIKDILAASDPGDLLPMFWTKRQKRARAIAAAACALNANRGLCEDYLRIDTVAPHRIGICADIELLPDADLEDVQARVYHAIETYLSPPVKYRTLEEMLADGRRPDEIFNGPFIDPAMTCGGAPIFTKPGFVADEDLAASEIRSEVRASDIINLVVDIEGVEAIRNLQILTYDASGKAAAKAEKWLLKVPPGHAPAFFMEASKLLFHKAGIPYRAQPTEFARSLAYLRALDRRDVHVTTSEVLPAPQGRWRNPDAVYPVQHDLPETYKIGTAGIAASEPDERIARARQLKGYLTFFDQVLADYLAQLTNLRRLFSLDRTLAQTYFTHYLTEAAGSLGDFPHEFFATDGDNLVLLQDDLTRTRLTESEEGFLERRNRLLDHLIARFAERFADYALLSYRLTGDRQKTSADLISDKIDFLTEYPALSRNRGQAANVRPEDPAQVWNSPNISGLERRAGRLVGIDDLSRRDLHCALHFGNLFAFPRASGTNRVTVTDAEGTRLFTSAETFDGADAARTAAATVYESLREEGAVRITQTEGATTWTLTLKGGGATLTHRDQFDTEVDATLAARAVLDRYDELLAECNDEGMHLVEHILLRPLAKGDPLMQVCLQDDCGTCGDEDPYTFRASVVLPYWPRRFRNPHFRALMERTLREEAPAHVQLRICWISQSQMTAFDATYRAWREARATRPPDPAAIRATTGDLARLIANLRTVYPAASLHDCDEGEDETTVRLGTTALGIY